MAKSIKRKLIIEGEEREVELLPDPREGFLTTKFDGIPFEMFLGEETAGTRLVLIDGHPFRVRTGSSQAENYVILVDEEKIRVFLMTSPREGLRIHETAIAVARQTRVPSQEKGEVTAHMPGRIVDVKVKLSDVVKVGDPMFVLLAMKMENTIVAPVSGIVKQVHVRRGASVNKGDILATIE